MKKPILFLLAALCASALLAETTPATQNLSTVDLSRLSTGIAQLKSAEPTITDDAYNKLKAERDAAQQQAALVPQYQQELRYQTILAERNELALRVVQKQLEETTASNRQLSTELTAAQAALAAEKAKHATPTPKTEEKK